MRVACVLLALMLSPAMAGSVDQSVLIAPAADTPQPTPTDVLAMEEGVWDAVIEFPPEAPDKAPTRATGVQTNTFVTGKRWIRNDFVVDARYGGHGVWGYDPVERKYVGIWVDSNQAYIRSDDGSYDASNRTMTWSSQLRQPAPHPPAKYRMTEEFRGDVRILTMTAIGGTSGKEVPLGKITFTRRRGST